MNHNHEKKYSITLLHQQSSRQHKTPNTSTTKQQKLKTKQNNKYLIDAFDRLPSNLITISPGQIQHDQQEIQELPSQKMEKP
jgi:hypothetical protein